MSLEREITHVMRETQERIFRVCQSRGLTLKAISVDSGIPYSTMRSYAGHNGNTAIMGVDALYKLVGVVPDELLSLMLPEDRAIVSVPTDIDHDEIERRCRDYLAVKGRAHRQDSPDGPAISQCEQTSLNTHAGFLRAVA